MRPVQKAGHPNKQGRATRQQASLILLLGSVIRFFGSQSLKTETNAAQGERSALVGYVPQVPYFLRGADLHLAR